MNECMYADSDGQGASLLPISGGSKAQLLLRCDAEISLKVDGETIRTSASPSPDLGVPSSLLPPPPFHLPNFTTDADLSNRGHLD